MRSCSVAWWRPHDVGCLTLNGRHRLTRAESNRADRAAWFSGERPSRSLDSRGNPQYHLVAPRHSALDARGRVWNDDRASIRTGGLPLSCPICGATASWPIAWRSTPEVDIARAEVGGIESYGWRLCRRCGNGYPTAAPDRRVLARVWAVARVSDDQDPVLTARQWQQRRAAARTHAERSYRVLAPLLGSRVGRFLDIACGLGETVRCFADHGWEAEGVDADPTMLPLHRQLAVRSRIGQIEDLEIAQACDVIHIAHAIYFITDPIQFLRRLRAHLTENGLLCVVLSDFLSPLEHNMPSYAHTFYPSAASMQFALALAGFDTVLVQKAPGSIYIIARPGRGDPPKINTLALLWRYRTHRLSAATIGAGARALRPIVRRLLRR